MVIKVSINSKYGIKPFDSFKIWGFYNKELGGDLELGHGSFSRSVRPIIRTNWVNAANQDASLIFLNKLCSNHQDPIFF
jgi:hypothetical protein